MIPPLAHPFVSIVVPVYNASAYLEPCLDSLSTQDFRDFEIIVVNDGSTDDSAARISQWAARDSRVTVLSHADNANLGVAATRNLGLTHARGEFIWFVDADDRVRPGAISQLVAAANANANDIDVIAFNACESGPGIDTGRIYRQPKPSGRITGEEWVGLSCRQKECPHLVWLRFYRRAYLEEIGLRFRVGIVHEDIAWITEGDLRAKHFVYTDAVLYDYQRNAQSITGSGRDTSLLRRAEGLITVVEQLRDINNRVGMSNETRKLLRAELVGQGLQVDRLRQHITDSDLRKRIDDCVIRAGLWHALWKDATRLTRKRQLAQVMLREWWQR
jgi:glycosyltransferase involved in cell wall biosynthesis